MKSRRWRIKILLLVGVALLMAPFIAGYQAIGDRDGPAFYPETLHTSLYIMGHEASSGVKPRMGWNWGLYDRPLFWGMERRPKSAEEREKYLEKLAAGPQGRDSFAYRSISEEYRALNERLGIVDKSVPEVRHRVGEYNEEGRLVFWEIDAFDHMEPFVLREDYGVLLLNEGGEVAPKPLYILAFQKTKEIFRSHDLEEFKAELAKVPKGAVVGRFETCTMPRSWGLPEEQRKTFRNALDERELVIEVDGRIVCYCPYGE